jgi:hypothetical protein
MSAPVISLGGTRAGSCARVARVQPRGKSWTELFQETKSSAKSLGSSTPLSPTGRLQLPSPCRVRTSAGEHDLTACSAVPQDCLGDGCVLIAL